MNQFLKKILFISLPVLGFMLLTFWQADGKADPFYLRFTTPKQHSLILGTSRAAQGLVPDVIDSVTGKKGMFNYAMTVGHSPYGKAYYESIEQKLNPGSKDGLFILEVSPWGICSKTNEGGNLREENRFLSKLHCVDCKPNVEYLVRFYSEPFHKLWGIADTSMYLHEDGWLEISVGMDSSVIETRARQKMDQYKNTNLPVYEYSEMRYVYLKKSIQLLQKHGSVYVVRMPVYPEMFDLENILMPDFDAKMDSLCESTGVDYLNYGADGSKYQFTDGNHLWKRSAVEFSKLLANDVLKLTKHENP